MTIAKLRAELNAQIKQTQKELTQLERAKMALDGKTQTRKRRKYKRRSTAKKTEPASEPAPSLETTPAQTV